MRLRQNGCQFPDENYKCICLNENIYISIKISLKFVPKGPTKNIPALVHKMAWHQPGDKPLSEPMMVSLLMHTCITQPQLEQLERLRSEDTPRRPVITLTIDQFILNPKSILLISSYRISSQKKVKAEKITKICEKIKIL